MRILIALRFPVLAAAAAIASAWAAPAGAQTDFEIVCPCTVATSNLTSVDVTFGVRNLLTNRKTSELEAVLEGRREGGDGNWRRLATVHLPALAVEATVESQTHTVATPAETSAVVGPAGGCP